MSALDVRQRAAMFLRDYKAGLVPDPNAARFNTDAERREFWRLVGIIDFCNDDLAQIVLLVREQVLQEALRVNWLRTVRVYASALNVCRRFLAESAREPATVSEARKRKPPKRGFDIYPDSDQQEVERVRRDRRFVDHLVGSWGAFDLALNARANAQETSVAAAAEVANLVRDGISMHWAQLRAVDAVLGKYAEEFGEDPLAPALRRCLDNALEQIVTLKDDLAPFVGAWKLRDGQAEHVAQLEELARRALT